MNSGHGNHWECLGKPVEELIKDFIPLTCRDGEAGQPAKRVGEWFDMAEPVEAVVTPIVYAPVPLGCMAIVVSSQGRDGADFLTAFPYAPEPPIRRVRITQTPGPEDQIEGVLTGEIGDAEVSFFDTHYYLNLDRYKVGEEYDFRLAGLIYKARCTNDETVQIENPETIMAIRGEKGEEPERLPDGSLAPIIVHIAGGSGLVPVSDQFRDDAEFYCVIEAVQEFRLDGIRIFQITPKIEEDNIALPAVIFGEASKFENGYVPKVGDSIGGGLWMQGYLDVQIAHKAQ